MRIATPGKNMKLPVYGAFRWPAGPFVYSCGVKSVNSALFVGMLGKLRMRARQTGKLVVLVIDNGSSNTSKLSREEINRASEFVDIFWLPRYSSEQLNEIENLWKHVKADYFCRMLVKNPKKFRTAAIRLLDSFKPVGAVRKLVKPPRYAPPTMEKNLMRAA